MCSYEKIVLIRSRIRSGICIGWLWQFCGSGRRPCDSKIEDHLVASNSIQDGLQLEDGQQMEWDKESIMETEIEENDCYVVTLCFASVSEFAENGDIVDGRRFASFAVSKDCQYFYKDNPAANIAADVWEAI